MNPRGTPTSLLQHVCDTQKSSWTDVWLVRRRGRDASDGPAPSGGMPAHSSRKRGTRSAPHSAWPTSTCFHRITSIPVNPTEEGSTGRDHQRARTPNDARQACAACPRDPSSVGMTPRYWKPRCGRPLSGLSFSPDPPTSPLPAHARDCASGAVSK